MEFSLETAGLATTVGLGVITLTLVYIWVTVVRLEAIAWWAGSFAALTLDYSMVLLKPLEEFGILIPAWEAAHATFLVCATIGVLKFLDRSVSFLLLGLAWAIIEGWGIYSAITHPTFVVQTVPATLIAVLLSAMSGVLLLRQRPEYGEPGYRLAGWAFLVWSFNRANFPLLAIIPWFAPIGYVIAQASAMAMGVGLLVAVLERLRRQALASEEEAQFNRDQVMDVLEASPVGTVVADSQTGKILFANRTFRKLVPDWGADRCLDDVLDVGKGPSWQQMALEVLPEGKGAPRGVDEVPSHEIWAQDRQGRELCLLNVVRPIRWVGKWRVQNTLVDITNLKLAEKALAEARDEAEAASVSKTRFLAAASHDLRQPLQALMMFVDAFDEEAMNKENSNVKERIEASLEALKKLLDTLLDISRLDAGLILADMKPVALGPIFDRLADELTPQAEAQNLAIGIVQTGRAVLADPVLLDTILRNLITNAIRYTDEGRILLGCRERNGRVEIGVWDTGRGISKQDLPKVFDDFQQVGNEGRDRRQGLGLGLSIVKRLATLMKMTVDVQSIPGKGSVFTIDAATATPSLKTAEQQSPLVQAVNRTGALITLIDDEQEVLEALAERLESMGHKVEPFRDIPEFENNDAPKSKTPDLIITDYRLIGGRNGLHAIEVLRNHFSTHIPAILLTGDTSPERLAEIGESGLPILHKPVAVDELREMINAMLDEGRPS